MEIHNTRSPKQREIISQHIDFKDKTVIDLGCGYGDMLFECYINGLAKDVWGVEENEEICRYLWSNFKEAHIAQANLEKWITQSTIPSFDVSICFSVLPYLDNPTDVLKWMKEHSKIALVECQYKGDGPGFDFIASDDDMRFWFEMVGWQSVEVIGKTFVEGRNKHRTIWLCQ